MVNRRKMSEVSSGSEDGGDIVNEEASSKRAKTEGDVSSYERIRQQRIKENMERMQKLGLADLSLKLKPPKKPPQEKKKKKKNVVPQNHSPQRRSSRIMSLEPVNYSYSSDGPKQDSSTKKEKKEKEVKIYIPEGKTPEVYTEEQEMLLGDYVNTWELDVDGYDEDGDRIIDPVKGEKCHQCRYLTVGQYTTCNKCELPQGQICGDCLFTRYGENVLEANYNQSWICPACRGICNCNSCRRAKGWASTGNIYDKVVQLGFKSVAHYLIKTRRSEKGLGDSGGGNIVAEETPETSTATTLNRATRTSTRRALRS